jgi:L-aspartate oxidase
MRAASVANSVKYLQQRMCKDAGLLRDAAGLRAVQADLDHMKSDLVFAMDRPSIELGNLHAVAELIVQSALRREESRGAHFRTDFPKRNDADYSKHSVILRQAVSFAVQQQLSLVP